MYHLQEDADVYFSLRCHRTSEFCSYLSVENGSQMHRIFIQMDLMCSCFTISLVTSPECCRKISYGRLRGGGTNVIVCNITLLKEL